MIAMSKLAFIGHRDAVLAFKALGAQVLPVSGPGEARVALERCVAEDYAIVFLTEPLARELAEVLAALPSRAVVTVIPDHRGQTGAGRARLKKLVEQAIGVDMLFKEEGS